MNDKYFTIYAHWRGTTKPVGAIQNPNPSAEDMGKAMSKFRAVATGNMLIVGLLKSDEGPTWIPEKDRIFKEYY